MLKSRGAVASPVFLHPTFSFARCYFPGKATRGSDVMIFVQHLLPTHAASEKNPKTTHPRKILEGLCRRWSDDDGTQSTAGWQRLQIPSNGSSTTSPKMSVIHLVSFANTFSLLVGTKSAAGSTAAQLFTDLP